ncbi:MAG: hypothetical protein AAFP98_01100 [Pseudomonadota bacterium]
MKKIMTMALCLATTTAVAETDLAVFAENSQAKGWGLFGESPAMFEAKVVDLLCEVTGDCADNCGDGRRQLGLLRTLDDVLVFPNKNSQTSFNGAWADLLPYCNQVVEVDGLLIEDDLTGAKNVYLVQSIRESGAEEWVKANNWTKVWAENHPEADGKGPWFRRDPRVLAEIAAEGYFGLGAEREAELKAELFE